MSWRSEMDMQELRLKALLTRERLAAELEISSTTIRNWETGRTEATLTPRKYLKALKLLQCSPEELAIATDQSLNQPQNRKPGRPRKQ